VIFDSFVGPDASRSLADAFRAKRLLVRSDDAPHRFDTLWSDWLLPAVFRFTVLGDRDALLLSRDGRRIPSDACLSPNGVFHVEALRRLWNRGVSVTLTGFDLYSDRVLSLVRSLEADLQCPMQVNLYVTPPHARALTLHRDDHDVVVLQIVGEKSWEVHCGGATPGNGAPGLTRARLRAGGLLYIPMGVVHAAGNSGPSASIHLTIGLLPLTWFDALRNGLEAARHASPALSLPLTQDGARTEGAAAVRRHLLSLAPFVDPAEQAERHHRRFAGFGVRPSELVSRDRLDGVTEATCFSMAVDRECVQATAACVRVSRPDRRAPLDLHPALAGTIDSMLRRRDFRPADLAGPDSDAAVALCRFLANVGVLALGDAA
jgi:hypothetical protein